MWHLYEEKTYTPKLTADLKRMDRILSLMTDYENYRLQRKIWAEKMNTRQMRHFFEEEFNEVTICYGRINFYIGLLPNSNERFGPNLEKKYF